jgi:predicted amidohydrolase YtcJ
MADSQAQELIMQTTLSAAHVSVPGFADHHAHLLRDAAGVPFPPTARAVREFHFSVAEQGKSPMDVLDPAPHLARPALDRSLHAALTRAATAGLVEITEMGMRSWAYLDALAALETSGPLPCRVRIYVASGLADEAGLPELNARRRDCGQWLRLEGIKFYADGWIGPRTCALCRDFADSADRGLLFADAPTLARRVEPLAGHGWRIATHAIGDRGVQTVLDAYDLVFAGDRAAMAAAAPRIEHASVLSAELISRLAGSGVVACIQPSFPVTDASELDSALGADLAGRAYSWTEMAAAGVSMLSGTDYPIEVLDPLPSLARFVSGSSQRPGFATADSAPPQARLPASIAFALMTDPAAGQTLLSADPRTVAADQIDAIEVLGTQPVPF